MTTKSSKSKYSGSNIKTFDSDVDKVRAKSQMYIGSVQNSDGLFTIVREPVDNATDEAGAGRNDYVGIHLYQKGTEMWVAVVDHGHGIPTEMRKVRGKPVSTLQAVFTELQAGGKFDDKAYETSIGTHGVGVTATNALSESLEVWSQYKGKCVVQRFKLGKPLGEPKSAPPPKLPGVIKGKGTIVKFVPDLSILGKKSSIKAIVSRIRNLASRTAYLNPGLKVEVFATIDGRSAHEKHYHKGGIADYLKHRLEELKCESLGKPFVMTGKEVRIAFSFTDAETADVLGHTNSLPNIDGGLHVDAFWATTHKVLRTQMTSRDKDFSVASLREGIVGFLDVRLSSPQFGSQTKEKLIDKRAKDLIEKHFLAEFTKWAAANKTLIKKVIARAGDLESMRQQHLQDKRALKALKTRVGANALPEKLAKVKHAKELFLVEGDSAGGSAKKARLLELGQEVLPLKGKILNVFRAKEGTAFTSVQVVNILRSMGFDPNKKEPYAKLRHERVILLADPDPDGHHINALILALFAKYLRPLLRTAKIFIVKGYEFKATINGKLEFADTRDELMAMGAKEIQHIKGWGEIDPDVLRTIAFDPATRQLIEVREIDNQDNKNFVLVVGEDIAARKRVLNIH